MPNSLHDRIQLINKQHAYRCGKITEEQEKESEISLVNTVEQVWAETQSEGVEKSTTENVVTLEDVYAKIEEMGEVLTKVAEDMAKVNKHINATQKMLKKGTTEKKEKKK